MIMELAEIMISQKLKQVLKERGISAAQLARAIKRSVETVRNHLYRDKTPSAEDFLLYCKALDLSVEDFEDCVDFSSVSPIERGPKPNKNTAKKRSTR